MPKKRHTLTLLPLLPLFLAGCNMLGAAAYKIAGEPDVPAEFELPKKPTVVMVENFANADLAAADAEFIAQRVQERLMAKDVVPVVRAEKIIELRGKGMSAFKKMTVKDVAKAVEAEQVLYVSFEAGGIGAIGGGSTLQGRTAVKVKVIDAVTGNTLWPQNITDGRSVAFETSPTDGTSTSPKDLRYKLYDGLAARVVRLFHKFKPSEQGETAANG
jgi:hypothetical protein